MATDYKAVEWAVMKHHATRVSVSTVFTVHVASVDERSGIALVTKDGSVRALQRVYVWHDEDGIQVHDAPCAHTRHDPPG
jgi:hypothetical protein